MRLDRDPKTLITDPRCQQRERLPDGHVEHLRGVLREMGGFRDPIIVYVGKAGRSVVAEGHCRLAAALAEGVETIEVDEREGEIEDAILYSLSANIHGAARRTDDVRKAIRTALTVWPTWTDARIAEAVHCSDKTVARWRLDLIEKGEIEWHDERVGRDGKTRAAKQPRNFRGSDDCPPGATSTTTPGGIARLDPDCRAAAESLRIGDRDRQLPLDDENEPALQEGRARASREAREAAGTPPAPPTQPERTSATGEDAAIEKTLAHLARQIDARGGALGRSRGYHRTVEAARQLTNAWEFWKGA